MRLNNIGMRPIPALLKKVAFDPLAAFESSACSPEASRMMILGRRESRPGDFTELGLCQAAGELK